MPSEDGLYEMEHDHAELNRRVLDVGALLRSHGTGHASRLAAALGDLREYLFLHFAREEEGLFPYVSKVCPELNNLA